MSVESPLFRTPNALHQPDFILYNRLDDDGIIRRFDNPIRAGHKNYRRLRLNSSAGASVKKIKKRKSAKKEDPPTPKAPLKARTIAQWSREVSPDATQAELVITRVFAPYVRYIDHSVNDKNELVVQYYAMNELATSSLFNV